MFSRMLRKRSVEIHHLHMGGPDLDAAACRSLLAPKYSVQLRALGVRFVAHASEADILLLTGVLLARNVDAVLKEIASLPQPSCIVAVGDCAAGGGRWAELKMPGLASYPIGHYVDLQYHLPGDPPSPADIIRIIGECSKGQ